MKSAQQWFRQYKQQFPSIETPCPYARDCGGCALQDLSYEDQLALKARWIEQQLGKFISRDQIAVEPLDFPWRYRNKSELSFGCEAGGLVLGYHAARSFTRVIDIEECLLLPKSMAPIARFVLDLARETGLPAYNPKTHQGVFRHLLMRASHSQGKALIGVVTTHPGKDRVVWMARELMKQFPDILGVFWGCNEGFSDVIRFDQLELVEGEGLLHANVGPYAVKHHILSFLQTSHVQADRIYRSVRDQLPVIPEGVAWDLYCGLGILGFYLASAYQTVYGIEVDEATLNLARDNARINHLDSLRFQSGPAENVLLDRRFWFHEAKPDSVVLDPPRVGAQKRVLASILGAKPKSIAYVSCNAQTLLRDLECLTGSYPQYQVKSVQAYDMFPQTHHVETVAILERCG